MNSNSDAHTHGADSSPTDRAHGSAIDDAWAAERALIVERLAECVRRSGQSGAPRLSFDASRARGVMPTMGGQPSFALMAYYCWDDTLVVDLEAVFGSPGAVDVNDNFEIAKVDGGLLHELGHRRDRRAELVLRWGWTLAAAVVGIGWAVSKFIGGDSVLMVAGAVALALFLPWCGVSVPWRRRQERRADAYMVDVGGPDISAAFLALVTDRHDPKVDTLKIYDEPHERRRRIEQRLARRRPPA